MSFEIKTGDTDELWRVFDGVIKKGQQTMLTLSHDGELYSLFVNPLPGK